MSEQATVEQHNAVEKAKQLQRLRERALIFREVFGHKGAPTKHGGVILDALIQKFGHALPPNVLDNNGRTDEYQTWRRLGHFDVLEYINTQLEWKESDHGNGSGSP